MTYTLYIYISVNCFKNFVPHKWLKMTYHCTYLWQVNFAPHKTDVKSETRSLITIICFIIVLRYAFAYGIDDKLCGVRFYSIQNFQGSYWSFYNDKWYYKDEKHINKKYITIPNRNLFRPKSIRVYSNNSEKCKGNWRFCLLKPNFCKTLLTLPTTKKSFANLRGMEIGRHRMGRIRIKLTKKKYQNGFIGKHQSSTVTSTTSTDYNAKHHEELRTG